MSGLAPPGIDGPVFTCGIRRRVLRTVQAPRVVDHAVRAGRPLGDEVVAVHDHAIQRATGRQESRTAFGSDHAADQVVHSPVLHTGQVA